MSAFPDGTPYPDGYIEVAPPVREDEMTIVALEPGRDGVERIFYIAAFGGDPVRKLGGRTAALGHDNRFGLDVEDRQTLEAATEALIGEIQIEYAPVVKLASRTRVVLDEMPENIRKVAQDFGLKDDAFMGTVLSTRRGAKALLWQWRELDAKGPIKLDASDVVIATPSFFDELLKAWPRAVLVDGSEDVEESFNLVKEKRS